MSKMHFKSEAYIPKELLDGRELTNFGFIPDITDEIQSQILSICDDAEFRDSVRNLLPRRNKQGECESGDIHSFLERVINIDNETESRAFSRIVDEGLHEVLENGIYVQRQALDEATLIQLESRQILKHEIYESTPTDVLVETIGGNSLAILAIDKGNPEVTSHSHTHNGSRAVTPLSKEAILVLPNRVIQLKRGDVVWMDPWTQHSFQEGTFLAYHSSEAGWQHEYAFNPLPENN